MFCANCKTEYRAGFTQCSDCGTTLVDTLPDAPRDGDVPELFWSGNSPRLYQEFRAALKAADIPFMDEPPVSYVYASLRPPLEIWTSKRDHDAATKVRRQITGEDDESQAVDAEPRPTDEDYQLRAGPSWMRAWATKRTREDTAQEANSDSDEPDNESRTSDDGSNLLKDYFSSTSPDDVFSGEFQPQDATAHVYSGDLDVAENLKACLREVGIPSALDAPENGTGGVAKLRVLPDHEARAKEIIREVLDATPPG